jgi:hypothetical protein
VGGLMSASVLIFLWSGFAEFWSVVMAILLGAVPAAVCSWLSDKPMRSVSARAGLTPPWA